MQASLKLKENHTINPSILREYDIRGIYGKTLTEDDAYKIGRAYPSMNGVDLSKPVCVGYDGRVSSPSMRDALIQGLTESGANVIDIGLGSTPLLYYSVFALNSAGGIMITGSHNPKDHNGFKLMVGKNSIHGQDIKTLGQIADSGNYKSGNGTVEKRDIKQQYVDELANAMGANAKPLKVVWDAGNGATGELMVMLCNKLKGEHILLNEEIDGTFPVHHPDPTVPENLEQLIETVRETKADLGVAFDGDGDRIGAVDANGRIVWGDQLMAVYASEVLRENKGATIIADVKASQTLFDEIAKMGGNPLMWKTGHSLVKSKMKETKSPLAGEMSGHIFFADKYYGFDDGLYGAVRLINIVASGTESLAQMIDKLPHTFSTPEIRIECEESEKFEIMKRVSRKVRDSGLDFSDVDGVRVKNKDGWWLLRASNTQAVLVGRCESDSEEGLKRLQAELDSYLKS